MQDTPISNNVGTIHKTITDNSPQKPEWLRCPEAVRIFGICRSSLYELISEGKIKSTCLRKRGAVRGIRLISFDSLAAFIEKSAQSEMGAE